MRPSRSSSFFGSGTIAVTELGITEDEVGAHLGDSAYATAVLDVWRAVKDLVAGSGLAFDDRGEHELQGVPDCWQLYAVIDSRS